jgi:glycosyltransferase involved in cell wall biosynthesis
VREAEVVLACTALARAHLDKLGGGSTPVELVYHGVNVDVQSLASPNNGAAPVILCAGRLVEKKGHATLLRAAALLHDRAIDFRLRLAGEGPQWAVLQRLVHQLGLEERVCFLGPLTESELAQEYTRADVFALACQELASGDRDGIPNVILEAMAAGLPVVTTTCGGVPEAVIDGTCGLLVPQRDEHALAGALSRLVTDAQLRRELGSNAREHVVSSFDRARHLVRAVQTLRAAQLLPEASVPRLSDGAPVGVLA